MKAKLKALSAYAPGKKISNAYFESILNTSDEWIRTRTGIVERRYAAADEFTGDLCFKAAQQLLADHPDLCLEDVDFIIVSTTTADHTVPSVASQLQHRLGIKNPGTIDLSSACAGFVYGIILAKSMIEAGTYRKVLVFGGDTLSKVLDFSDRRTAILFGDGAGVALVEAADETNIFRHATGTDGSGGEHLYRSTLSPYVNGVTILNDAKSHQNGRVVFKWAIQTALNTVRQVLAANHAGLDEIDFIVLHSANLRIIEAAALELQFPLERMPQSVTLHGNTSSASIPLALSSALKSGQIKKGDRGILAGFGGGLTYAGIMLTL